MRLKLIVVMIVVLMLSSVPGFMATGAEYTEHAEILNDLGLFNGTNNGFELERAPKRVEVAAMLVKFLGAEEEANLKKYSHPFTDVPAWADNLIGYMYEKGLTTGIGNNLFGSNKLANSRDYTVFVLKALGYDSTDFSYSDTMNFAVKKGLISADEKSNLEAATFTRGEMVYLSYRSLFTDIKAGTMTLGDKLGMADIEEVSVTTSSNFTFSVSGDKVTLTVDKASLPENVKNFTKIGVGNLSNWKVDDIDTLLYWYIQNDELETATYASNYKYDNFYSTFIYFLDDDANVLGYTGYKGQAITGKKSLDVKTLSQFKMNIPEISTGLTLENDGSASLDIKKLPSYAQNVKRVVVSGAEFNTLEGINFDCLMNSFGTKNDLVNGSVDIVNINRYLNNSVHVYLYDSNNECLGYKTFELEDILTVMNGILNQKSVIDITSGVAYRTADMINVVPLKHELEKIVKNPHAFRVLETSSDVNPISVAYTNLIGPKEGTALISYQGMNTTATVNEDGYQTVLMIIDKNDNLLGYHVIKKSDLNNRSELFKSASIKLAVPLKEDDAYSTFLVSEYYINGVKQLSEYVGTVDSGATFMNGETKEINLYNFIFVPGIGMEVKFIPQNPNIIVDSVEIY